MRRASSSSKPGVFVFSSLENGGLAASAQTRTSYEEDPGRCRRHAVLLLHEDPVGLQQRERDEANDGRRRHE